LQDPPLRLCKIYNQEADCSMEYENPSVVVLGAAAELIQGTFFGKDLFLLIDSYCPLWFDSTPAAYQVDE
jgi:hypothetical protein